MMRSKTAAPNRIENGARSSMSSMGLCSTSSKSKSSLAFQKLSRSKLSFVFNSVSTSIFSESLTIAAGSGVSGSGIGGSLFVSNFFFSILSGETSFGLGASTMGFAGIEFALAACVRSTTSNGNDRIGGDDFFALAVAAAAIPTAAPEP